jgi:hypothetical protein
VIPGGAVCGCGDRGGEGHNHRLTVSPWFRPLFILQPDVPAMSAAGFSFQLHTLIGMLLFAIWPFTRLVHAFTAPRGTCSAPTSSTDPATPASPPERHDEDGNAPDPPGADEHTLRQTLIVATAAQLG